VAASERRHVLVLRGSFADIPPADPKKGTKPIEDYANRPAAANNLLRALFSMMTGRHRAAGSAPIRGAVRRMFADPGHPKALDRGRIEGTVVFTSLCL
jgi:hypothetical protein